MLESAEYSKGNWNYPTNVRFGSGAIEELGVACKELGIQRPLLVTDSVLADLPLTTQTCGVLDNAGLEHKVFSEIKSNPNGQNVTDGTEALKAGDHDGVIAFGGGSALDAAKAIALMAGQERPLWDFEDIDDWFMRVNEAGMLPVVAVPTTSGTGSEVGRSSVIVDAKVKKKKVIFHPKMLPGRVICDPKLSAAMPPKLTGAVGMDALSHNLEAYCASLFHPMADGIAVEGMRLIRYGLERAHADGQDLAARAAMMAASLMGATAFQKGLGAMHAVAHAVGAAFDTHHGTTVAVMMPYVLVLNRSMVKEKLARLSRYLGLTAPSFDAVFNWILEVREQVGIPHTLAELGVAEEHAPELATAAVADPTASTNPVPLTQENLEGLIRRALQGDLG